MLLTASLLFFLGEQCCYYIKIASELLKPTSSKQLESFRFDTFYSGLSLVQCVAFSKHGQELQIAIAMGSPSEQTSEGWDKTGLVEPNSLPANAQAMQDASIPHEGREHGRP